MSQDALTSVDAFLQLLEYAIAGRRSQGLRADAQADQRPGGGVRSRRCVAAEPRHLDAVVALAGPGLSPAAHAAEAAELRSFIAGCASEGLPHDEAIRLVLARVLVSPAFLYRIERAAGGSRAGPGLRLGAGEPAELFPLVVDAR